MEIIEEIDITPHKAYRKMHAFAKDDFIEENDPELAKSLTFLSDAIGAAQEEIQDAEIPVEEQVEVKEEEPAAEATETPEPEVKHRRKHRSKPTE